MEFQLTFIASDKKELDDLINLLTAASGKTITGKSKTAVKPVAAEEEEDNLLDEEEAQDESLYTAERVREKCQELIAANKSAKLKTLLKEFGAAKVVNLQEKDFNAFMEKANKIK